MSEGLGLEAWEIREIRRVFMTFFFGMLLVMAPAMAAAGLHWVVLAYAAGAALAWTALRMDGAPGGGHPLRRVLAWISEREFRFVVVPVMVIAIIQVFAELMIVPLEPLKGLWDPEMTKAEIAEAIVQGARQARTKAELWIVLAGISGISYCLLSGVSDWLLLGSVGARLGVRPWRLLGFGRSRHDMRKYAVRERARRRRLLGGEAPE